MYMELTGARWSFPSRSFSNNQAIVDINKNPQALAALQKAIIHDGLLNINGGASPANNGMNENNDCRGGNGNLMDIDGESPANNGMNKNYDCRGGNGNLMNIDGGATDIDTDAHSKEDSEKASGRKRKTCSKKKKSAGDDDYVAANTRAKKKQRKR